MARKYPADVLRQATDVLEGMKQITPSLTVDGWTATDLEADLASAASIPNQMASLKGQLTTLRNQRDDIYNAIWSKVKRVRQAVKGLYGDDSNQYELVGGTRTSERNPYTPPPSPPPPDGEA